MAFGIPVNNNLLSYLFELHVVGKLASFEMKLVVHVSWNSIVKYDDRACN